MSEASQGPTWRLKMQRRSAISSAEKLTLLEECYSPRRTDLQLEPASWQALPSGSAAAQ